MIQATVIKSVIIYHIRGGKDTYTIGSANVTEIETDTGDAGMWVRVTMKDGSEKTYTGLPYQLLEVANPAYEIKIADKVEEIKEEVKEAVSTPVEEPAPMPEAKFEAPKPEMPDVEAVKESVEVALPKEVQQKPVQVRVNADKSSNIESTNGATDSIL